MRPPRLTVVNIHRSWVRPSPRYERFLTKFSMSSKLTKPFARVGRNATTVASTSTTGASQRTTPLRIDGGAALTDGGREPRAFLLIAQQGFFAVRWTFLDGEGGRTVAKAMASGGEGASRMRRSPGSARCLREAGPSGAPPSARSDRGS